MAVTGVGVTVCVVAVVMGGGGANPWRCEGCCNVIDTRADVYPYTYPYTNGLSRIINQSS